MNKSIPAFILGLILSIIGAISAYLFYGVFIIIGVFTNTIQTLVTLLPLINIISFGIAFIGSIFCLIKKKIGGIILLIASTISLLCYIVVIITLKLYQFNVLIFIVPTILILIIGLTTFKTKKVH
ncbi:MAG: hypothetical protein J6Q13_01905 [Clostridia bacterium]|nr:hypothetical protein [Clostridia bacterium]